MAKAVETESASPTPFGEALREWREANGWTQEQLGEAAGVDATHVSYLERGLRGKRIGRDIVIKLAQALGAPIDEWLELTGFATPATNRILASRMPFETYIKTEPRLTTVQKAELIETYYGFVGRPSRRRKTR